MIEVHPVSTNLVQMSGQLCDGQLKLNVMSGVVQNGVIIGKICAFEVLFEHVTMLFIQGSDGCAEFAPAFIERRRFGLLQTDKK